MTKREDVWSCMVQKVNMDLGLRVVIVKEMFTLMLDYVISQLTGVAAYNKFKMEVEVLKLCTSYCVKIIDDIKLG